MRRRKKWRRDGVSWVSSLSARHSQLCLLDVLGCDIEEYPFGNSQAKPAATNWDDRDFDNGKVFPVLRLIPHAENLAHGTKLGAWLGKVKNELKKQKGSTPTTFTYCKHV